MIGMISLQLKKYATKIKTALYMTGTVLTSSNPLTELYALEDLAAKIMNGVDSVQCASKLRPAQREGIQK
jgi:hypothetical protein